MSDHTFNIELSDYEFQEDDVGPGPTLWERWLREASDAPPIDSYSGKRETPRHPWRGRLDLEVALPNGRHETCFAEGRDLGPRGIRFFCRNPLPVFSTIEMREAGAAEHVRATVQHCTQTVNGYLIGATLLD